MTATIVTPDGRSISLEDDEWKAVVDAIVADHAAAHTADDDFQLLGRVIKKLVVGTDDG